MEQGQAVQQPQLSNEDAARQAALAILQKDPEFAPEKPRDDAGRFKSEAAPEVQEAPVEEAQPEEPQETKAEIRRLKLKYKGEELEKEEPEVIELAQKGFDYTQKSQALAKEREELQQKIRSEIEAKQSEYEKQLEIHRQAVLRLADPDVLNADLAKLAIEDPAKAQQLFFKRQQIAETLTAIGNEQQKIATQRQDEMKQFLSKQAREAVEILQTEIPGWSNDLYGKVLKTGMDYGFKAEEVNAITDPRAIKVLNDARQWREFKAAKPATQEKKVTTVPKVVKPGTAEKPDQNANKWKDGLAQLQKTGGKEYAAVDLAKMILERDGYK